MIEPNIYAASAFVELAHAWLICAGLLLVVWAISFATRRFDP